MHKPDSRASLFDREVTEDDRREWTDRVSTRKQPRESASQSIVIFRIEREWLALPTVVLQEVIEKCAVRTLPHRRGLLGGLANVRGDLLLCISLRVLLGLEAAPASQQPRTSRARLLICRHKGDRFAFRADEVHGVHRYDPKELRACPLTHAKSAVGVYIAGILPWADRTVGCLNGELVFEAANRGIA